MRLRKDIIVYLHDPSRRFFHIAVELKNIPGALHSVLGIFRDLNLNILGSFSSVDGSAKTGVWSAFVEDSHHTASELNKKMSSSEYVLRSTVVESKDGFLIDGLHFPVSWNTGDRAFMGRARYFARMLHKIREEFGTGGEKIVYDEGYVWGKETWTEMMSRIGTGFARSNLNDVLKFYQAQGWFKLDGVERNEDDGRIVIRTSESFECMGGGSRGPYSHFIRGHLSGALSAILDTEMTCEETKCIAAGNQYCEFELRPMAIPRQVNAQMQALSH